MLLATTIALADGDPASDVLLGQNAFYPYSRPVSAPLQHTLNAEIVAAARARFPIKVALIASPTDLGVVPDLFEHPQKYADFLDQEISFQGMRRLLVVMPNGYGVEGLSEQTARAASRLTRPAGSTSNALAQAAIAAIPKLAAAAGHPINTPTGTPPATPSNSPTTLILAILAIAAVTTAGSLIAIRQRHHRTR
jgi:hypothetical protein